MGISGRAFGSFRNRLGVDFGGLRTVLGRLGGDFLKFLTKWATELRTLTDFVRQEEVMASRPVADCGQEENVRGCRYPSRSDQDSKHVQANSRQKRTEACRDKAKQTHPRREAEGPARLKISMPELHPGVGACGRRPLRVRRPRLAGGSRRVGRRGGV